MRDKNKKDLIKNSDKLSEQDAFTDEFMNQNMREDSEKFESKLSNLRIGGSIASTAWDMHGDKNAKDSERYTEDVERYAENREEYAEDSEGNTGEAVKRNSGAGALTGTMKPEKKADGKKTTKKNRKFINIYAFIMTVTAVAAIIMCVRFYNEKEESVNIQENNNSIGAAKGINDKDTDNKADAALKTDYSDSELKSLIKDYMENNKGTLEMLREIFPENVVVFHSNQYVFIPILEDIEKNDIDNEKLKKLDTGEITYEDNDKVSHKGIDVSKFQGDIDWKKVKQSGVEYAIVRVGYRGYGTGEIVADENAEKNIAGALAAGIKVGAYFFSQAVTEAEAVEEAEFVINIINQYHITYPVFFDTEDILNDNDRAGALSVEERTGVATAFCERIRKAGYTPAIYANLKWYTMSLDMTKLEEYDKWLAYYDSEIYFPYKISMWQYTERGNVDGISGEVDMNISFKEWDNK